MTPPLLNGLNDAQKSAVKHTEGPVLILAGAGSGKTKVLTHRVAYLIQQKHVSPSRILMCTFTNKAAKEMKERVSMLLSGIEGILFAGTFHSLCAKILRKEGHVLGFSSRFSIYDETDQLDAIKRVMETLNISQKDIHPQAALATISQAKNELISPSSYFEYAQGAFQKSVARIYSAYQDLLKKSDAADFDDLLCFCVALFQKHPEILGKYQETYQYILVDEYQDTNKAQYAITKLLSGRHGNICVVGDISQSIYGWRGADYRNILHFTKDFPRVLTFHLEQNYRSTQFILDAAHGVISKNTLHPVLKLWTYKTKGEKITLYEARNEKDEAVFIAQTILQSDRPFTDFAVLYRTNAQSRTVEEIFIRYGIPYILVGGIRFYERKEIKDVLAYLKLLANPKDMVSYERAAKLGKKRLSSFLTFAQKLYIKKQLISSTTLELLDAILKETRYADLYDAQNEEDAYRLENIQELRSVATEFPDLAEFLENVALVEQEYYPDEIKKRDEKRKGVTLMTIHSAKGLEFATVFMIGLEEGLFPHSRSLLEKEEIEEERRLCYVGITRAKEKLYLIFANRRLYFGQRTQNRVSRFISDIPEHVLESQVSLDSSWGFDEDTLLL